MSLVHRLQPSLILAAALLATLLTGAFTPAALCDATSALTPIGVDTTRGQVLFAVPALAAGGEGRGTIVEWTWGELEANAYTDPGGGWFGGSVGPGAVLAAAGVNQRSDTGR